MQVITADENEIPPGALVVVGGLGEVGEAISGRVEQEP